MPLIWAKIWTFNIHETWQIYCVTIICDWLETVWFMSNKQSVLLCSVLVRSRTRVNLTVWLVIYQYFTLDWSARRYRTVGHLSIDQLKGITTAGYFFCMKTGFRVCCVYFITHLCRIVELPSISGIRIRISLCNSKHHILEPVRDAFFNLY